MQLFVRNYAHFCVHIEFFVGSNVRGGQLVPNRWALTWEIISAHNAHGG